MVKIKPLALSSIHSVGEEEEEAEEEEEEEEDDNDEIDMKRR